MHIPRGRRHCVNKKTLFCLLLVYDQVAHMFHIMFTWSQFTCYIILVLLLLALPWESNVFYASVSGCRYICSTFITVPMIHDKGSDMIGGVRAWSKGEYYCWRTGDRKGLCLCYVFILCCVLYLCCFCKLLGFVFMHL